MQIWGMAFTSKIEILDCIHLKALHVIVVASWFVPSKVSLKDLQTPTVKKTSAATAFNTMHTKATAGKCEYTCQ
jgi:hypothetical protein